MKAASSKISQLQPPTPRDASGPEERATTLHPFLYTSSLFFEF